MRKFMLLGLCLGMLSGCSRSPGVAAASATPTPTVFKVAEVGLEYSLPAGWKKDRDGQLANAEDNLIVQFVQPPASDQGAEGLKAIAARLNSKFTDVKIGGEPSERSNNGLHLLSLRGSGKVQNTQTEWELVLLEGGPRPFLLVEIASGAGSLEKHRSGLDQLATSFRVTEGVNLPPLAAETPAAAETPVATETPVAEAPEASETPEGE